MKLDIGCGAYRRDGFTGVDKFFPTDVKADALVLPFPPDSVDEIYCSHMFEHLTFAQHQPALLEWKRVLIQGGKLTIIVPSMDYVAAIWLHGGDRHYAEQIMFGSQDREGETHLSGFRVADLNEALRAAGFKVRLCRAFQDGGHHQESIHAEAVKP